MSDAGVKVLVTGGGGQLSTELARAQWPEEVELRVLDAGELDITSADAVDSAVADFAADYVVNAAAYTAVDKAEDEPEIAQAVNVGGVENLVAACREFETGLVHVSTDYVFDGFGPPIDSDRWRNEADPANPINTYGQTKLDGELAALDLDRSVVLRTSWVYSSHGHNFVKTMIRLASEGKDLGVVHDQQGCPTAAVDLATVIVGIIQQGMPFTGLFHCASPTDASWWDLADAAVGAYGFDTEIRQLTTDEYPLPAKRPADTRISSEYLSECYHLGCRPWRVALADVVEELKAERFV